MSIIQSKTTILLATTSLLSLFAYTSTAEEVSYPSCAEMGYTSNVDDCISAGGVPLLCPYSNADNKACICQIRSCRGYPLFKEGDDYYYNTLDGGKIKAVPTSGKLEDYIDGELESCTVGYGNDALTYYRVSKCLDGYMYQNNICDKGCDVNQYPFTTHPGNLAGEVQVCKDENGEHYGYTKCNAGWLLNGASCILNSCDIKEYIYMSDPNEDEYRGEVEICKIGGNAYYKYKSCDAGFEPKMGVCVSKCEITDCTSTPVTVTSNGTSRTYNEWTCKLNNPKCRIGDTATYQGIDVGTIFHLPDGEDNRVHVVGIYGYDYWSNLEVAPVKVPEIGRGITDMNGKKNTKLIINFREEQGWEVGTYPVAEKCVAYSVNCVLDAVCASGEWYLISVREQNYLYSNRYILSKVWPNNMFTSGIHWTSTEDGNNVYNKSYANGGLHVNSKHSSARYFHPVLSFIASNSSDFID